MRTLLSSAFLCSRLLTSVNAESAECEGIANIAATLVDEYPCLRSVCQNPTGNRVPMPSTTPPAEQVTPPPSDAPPGEEVLPPIPPRPAGDDVVVGTYFPNWQVYAQQYMGINRINDNGGEALPGQLSNKFSVWPTQLPAEKLTHIFYAFWGVDESCAVQDFDPNASWWGATNRAAPFWINTDAALCNGALNDLLALKHRYPHLKLIVSIGGWTYSENFSRCAQTAGGRSNIATSLDYWFHQIDENYGKANAYLDGVDFDWEHPEGTGKYEGTSHSDDWANYAELLQHVRKMTQSNGRSVFQIFVSVGLGSSFDRLIQQPALHSLADAVDYFNIMAYDLWGNWADTTGHNAPFCADPRIGNPVPSITVSSRVQQLLQQGIDAKRLVLGLPTSAHSWTGINPGNHGNGLFMVSSDADWKGYSSFSARDDVYKGNGLVQYWDLLNTFGTGNGKFHVSSMTCPETAGVKVPIKYAYSADLKIFLSYDDTETVKAKAEWAKAVGLGGFYFFHTAGDTGGTLLDAAREGWGGLPTGALAVDPAGKQKCFDSHKPLFLTDPVSFCDLECTRAGQSTGYAGDCRATEKVARSMCGGKTPRFVGADRDGECVLACTPQFYDLENTNVRDTLYFTCT